MSDNIKVFLSQYSGTPLIRTLVIRTANYADWIDPSSKFVEGSIILNCREATGYRIQYSTVLWLLEIQIRGGRKVSDADKKGKAIPLQAWTGPEGSRKFRLPDFKTIGT